MACFLSLLSRSTLSSSTCSTRLFMQDAKIFDRLHRRRLGIRKYLLPSARSLVPGDSKNDRCVWVSTRFLRQYLKCQPDDELDCILESRDPIIQNNDFRCPHGDGLEPHVAHTGKLLSLRMYVALVALLRGERALVRGELQDADAGDEVEIEDYLIGSDINLICKECSTVHRDNLSRKLGRVRVAKALFAALDPVERDAELTYEDTEASGSVDRFVFAISRQSALKFRRNFTLFMKSLAKTAAGESAARSPTHVGIGTVSLASFECEDDDGSSEFKNFNESITCK